MSNDRGRDHGKGKGRAQDEGITQDSSEEPSQDSLLSRVLASASGLTQSAFASPSSNELSDQLAGTLASSGKGQHSGGGGSGGNSSWAESSSPFQQAGHSASGSSTFRHGHQEEHIKQSENEFSSFLDNIPSLAPPEQPFSEKSRVPAVDSGFDGAWTRAQPTKTHTRVAAPTTIAEQEERDGEEVLSILSKPGGTEDAFEAPEDEEENYDWGLSAQQISRLRPITREILPPPEQHETMPSDHPLNLVPKFQASGDPLAHVGHGNGHLMTAREQWREQWEGVLNRYTDEVWGGLLPLVKEARQEVEQSRDQIPNPNSIKALRRLRMVLEHVQK